MRSIQLGQSASRVQKLPFAWPFDDRWREKAGWQPDDDIGAHAAVQASELALAAQ
jgi:hypothetical protein